MSRSVKNGAGVARGGSADERDTLLPKRISSDLRIGYAGNVGETTI